MVNYDLCRGAGDFAAFRTDDRDAPFNLYVNVGAIRGDLKLRPQRAAAALRPRQALPTGSDDGKSVAIRYPLGHTVGWTWDGAHYLRSQDGAPDVEASGDRISTDVVVVQRAHTTDTSYFGDAGYHEVSLVGSGNALIAAAGREVAARWSRPSLADPSRFTAVGGASLPLPPGRVFFEVIPEGATVE